MSSAYSAANLKHSSLYFLTGKIASAILNFSILILLARLLESSAYGAYATLFAIKEVGLAVANLGIGWVGHRYIPEYRLHASSKELGRFITSLIMIRLLALVAVGLIFFSFEEFLAHYLHLEAFGSALHVYILVLIVEGIGNAIREDIFAALLQQKKMQFIMICRSLALLLLLIYGTNDGELSLAHFVWMELSVSLLATGMSIIGILAYLLQLKQQRQAEWEAPKLDQFVHTAAAMYVNFLLTIVAGRQVFMFIINRLLGLEAAAIFGFANNLNSMLTRYLPAELLMGLIRPKLVADYTLYKDKERLSNDALFVWKLSLAILIPAVSFFIVYGESFTMLISTGKYTGAGAILAGLSIVLIPFSQRHVLEALVIILGQPRACVTASFVRLLCIPLVLILIEQGLGLWALIIALLVGELIFNISLVQSIKRLGCPYGLNPKMASKLMVLIGGVTFTLWYFMNLPSQVWIQKLINNELWEVNGLNLLNHAWVTHIFAILLAILVTIILGRNIGFFSKKERKTMLNFLKR